MTTWSNEETLKFIVLYRKEGCIWNPKDRGYKNRSKVSNAWDRISDVMDIPVNDLKRKKETLMTIYRLHLKKKNASIERGVSDDKIYKPTWLFYETMEEFLKDVYENKSNINTEEDKIFPKKETDEESDDNEFSQKDADSASSSSQRVVSPVRKKLVRTQKRRSNHPNVLKVNAVRDSTTTSSNEVPSDSECDLYGKLIAKKLRMFSDFERDYLMYEIDGLILRKLAAKHHLPYFNTPSSLSTYPNDLISSSVNSDCNRQLTTPDLLVEAVSPSTHKTNVRK